MPFQHEGPPLDRGPSEYVGQTARATTAAIMAYPGKYLPAFYNNKRAWQILGYGKATTNNPKPDFDTFTLDVRAFWAHHVRYDKTRLGRRVRALILDALRALGIRSLWWTSSMKSLNISGHDGTFDEEAVRPGKGNYGESNSWAWQKKEEPPTCYQQEHHSAGEFEIKQWQKYHRYQGFYVADRNPDDLANVDGSPKYEARYFRAIAMPEGPDSLLYALSYHTGGKRDSDPAIEGPYFGSPYVTKMRIWTYFVQTLKDHHEARWKDYHILNTFSVRRVEGHGECSLLRSLYAGRDQGRPAYSAWPSGINHDAIFHVVADYFGTQVIVFAIDARLPVEDPVTHEEIDYDSDTEFTIGQRPHILPYRSQGNRGYQYRAYGHMRPGQYKQILLATSDWKHFDAVDWDQPCHWKASYFPANWPDQLMDKKLPRLTGPQPAQFPDLTAQERMTFERPFQVEPGKIRKIPAPWWRLRHQENPNRQPPYWVTDEEDRLPCQQARYNRIERHHLPRDADGNARTVIENPIDLVEQEYVSGPMPYALGARNITNADTLVEDEIVRHFIAHHDIPGWSFVLPAPDLVNLWLVARQELEWERAPKTPKRLKPREATPELGQDDTPDVPITPKTPRHKIVHDLPVDATPPVIPTPPGTVARWVVKHPEYRQLNNRVDCKPHPQKTRYQLRFGRPPMEVVDGKEKVDH
ncbi:hypothetical protein QBC37DRAFT_50374 [Rhypophila decipiens]|uniref:Uncharacterized protein n=1 Tax=Rhypophila decipiens TaxID=261697 RepID=A0AAN7B437_9PEZI|nr:hypothetical protein QBC37DRAFT_50374 [Rhypophila decipiens]